MGTLHEDVCTFMTITCSILLGMRSVSNQVVGKIKTPILCSVNIPIIVPFMR